MMKRAKGGRNCEIQQSKPDDFLRAKYEHMMGGSGLIGFLQILMLEAEGHPGLREQFWSLRGAASDTSGHVPKRYRRWPVFWPGFEDYRLPFTTDVMQKGTVSPVKGRL